MCPRLIRLRRALDGEGSVRKPGKPIVPNAETICQDSRDAAAAFMQEHESLCSSGVVGQTSCPTDGDMTHQPLELAEYELLHFLVMAEHYSRESVKFLPDIREIDSDPMGSSPPSETALSWIFGMIYIANELHHLLNTESSEYTEIVRQQIRLTPALDNFLQLAIDVRSCLRVLRKQPPDHLSWPSPENLEYFDPNAFSPITDIVTRLEVVQSLLEKQGETRDRGRRDNYDTALEVVKRKFQHSSNVIAIRLDLGHRKGFSQGKLPIKNQQRTDQLQIAFKTASNSFNVFKDHVYKVFDRLRVEYLVKMEYGLKRGYHYHVLILIDVQQHQQDVIIGKMLGDYWVQVATGGDGIYWNGNAKRKGCQYSGIGMIHRNDEEKRKYLETKVVHYLFKYDIPFELIKIPRARKFRTSKEKGKAGSGSAKLNSTMGGTAGQNFPPSLAGWTAVFNGQKAARRNRRPHTPAFKAQVALAALQDNKTMTELCQQFGLHSNQITDWRNQLLADTANVFGG